MAATYRGSMRRSRLVGRIVVYALLVGFVTLNLVPFVWMLSTALKPDSQLFIQPPVWIPRPVMWANFARALTSFPFLRYLGNTVYIAVLNVIGVLLASSLVAYGFARLRAPGRDFLFILLLATMMIPGQVTMIPVFILFQKLGWLNTFKPLTIPAFLGGGAFNIFLLRQFYLTIPQELSDAARIDGCSEFGIYRRIMLPLAKPALAAIGIFTFQGNWGDLFGPLIYLNDETKYTLALGLQSFQNFYRTEYALLAAASIVITLPMIIVFFAGQRYFIEGVTLTGIKG